MEKMESELPLGKLDDQELSQAEIIYRSGIYHGSQYSWLTTPQNREFNCLYKRVEMCCLPLPGSAISFINVRR